MIEDLLTELADIGWTVSWAFQFEPDHWRVSIIKIDSWNGYDQPDTLISCCADAPTFAEALEDAIAHRDTAEFSKGAKCIAEIEPDRDLVKLLNLSKPQPPIVRRM